MIHLSYILSKLCLLYKLFTYEKLANQKFYQNSQQNFSATVSPTTPPSTFRGVPPTMSAAHSCRAAELRAVPPSLATFTPTLTTNIL